MAPPCVQDGGCSSKVNGSGKAGQRQPGSAGHDDNVYERAGAAAAKGTIEIAESPIGHSVEVRLRGQEQGSACRRYSSAGRFGVENEASGVNREREG